MQQQKKKGAVIKGLAFPIGYTVFMNVFQGGAIALIAIFCLIRALLAYAAAPEIGSDALSSYFYTDYADTVTQLTWFLSVLTTVLAVVILFLVFNRKGRNFTEYFRFKRTSFKAIMTAVLMGLSLFFIVSGIMTVLEMLGIVLIEWIIEFLYEIEPQLAQELDAIYNTYVEAMNASGGDTAMFTIAAVLGAPLIEELTFRAGPLTNLTNRMRTFPAILITSALFGLAHGNPIQMVYTFVLGIVMGYLFVKTDSIYPSIVCHLVFNGANLISMLLGSLFDTTYWEGHSAFDEISTNLNLLSNITFWIYLVLSFLIAIPMLAVGIILLVTLRRPAPAEAPVEAPAVAQIAAPVEVPAESQVEEPAETQVEAQVEAPVEEQVEEPAPEFMEEFVQEPAQDPTQEPMEEPACAVAAEETV